MTTAGESEFTAEELRRISEEVSAAFPLPRTESRLVLMDVDPRRVHAYWSLDAAAAGTGSLLLRLTDVTGDSRRRPDLEIPVQGLTGGDYVDLTEDGRSLVAEIGVTDGDGFRPLARSNTVSLPHQEPPPPPPAAPPRPPADNAFPTVGAVELETYRERARQAEAAFVEAVGEDVPPLPAIAPPASAAPAVAQDVPTSHSSFGLAAPEGAPEIHAELHVFGRARPGEEPTLFGQPVRLRPDGSFSVRRPVADLAAALALVSGDDGSAE